MLGVAVHRAHKTIRGCIYPCKWRSKNEIIFQFSLNGFTFVVIAAPCLAHTHSNEDVEQNVVSCILIQATLAP